MRSYCYRYLPRETGVLDDVATDLEYEVLSRRTTYDCYLRDINGSSPFNLLFAGNVLGTDFPFGADRVDEGEAKRLADAKRAAWQRLCGKLDEPPNNLVLFYPNDNSLLFFYCPEGYEEVERLRKRVERLSRQRQGTVLDSNPIIEGAQDSSNSEAGVSQVGTNWVVYQVTVGDILSEIQYHLLEPTIDGGQTWQFWTFAEVFNYLRERVTRFLLETRLIKDRTTLSVTSASSAYDLDPLLVDLYRVFNPSSGVVSRTSRWEMDRNDPTWGSSTTTSSPTFYFEDIGTEQFGPLSVKFVPAPTTSMTMEYNYIKQTPLDLPAGGGEAATGSASSAFIYYPLRIPGIFAWGIKYGIMADMLSRQGEGNDPTRATYAQIRWNDCVALARLMMGEKVEIDG